MRVLRARVRDDPMETEWRPSLGSHDVSLLSVMVVVESVVASDCGGEQKVKSRDRPPTMTWMLRRKRRAPDTSSNARSPSRGKFIYAYGHRIVTRHEAGGAGERQRPSTSRACGERHPAKYYRIRGWYGDMPTRFRQSTDFDALCIAIRR